MFTELYQSRNHTFPYIDRYLSIIWLFQRPSTGASTEGPSEAAASWLDVSMVSFLRCTSLKGMQDNCIPLKIKLLEVWQITGIPFTTNSYNLLKLLDFLDIYQCE
jgi:hypothetical protein